MMDKMDIGAYETAKSKCDKLMRLYTHREGIHFNKEADRYLTMKCTFILTLTDFIPKSFHLLYTLRFIAPDVFR